MMGRAINVRPAIPQARVTPGKVQVEGGKAKPISGSTDSGLASDSELSRGQPQDTRVICGWMQLDKLDNLTLLM